MHHRLVYVTAGSNPRVASYRMGADTVRLWREAGFDAEHAQIGNVPDDADAYVFCKCVPKERPHPGAMVALHMHDFWDGEANTVRATVARLVGAPIDVLVPCSVPYEGLLSELAMELDLGMRVAWCPESPVFGELPPPRHPPQDGPFRVGFHGTGSTFRFLSGEPARGLERVAKEFPLELVVLSNFPRKITEEALKESLRLQRVRVRYAQWSIDTYDKEIGCWDVAVLPASHGNEYSMIKSSNRLREVARHAVPVVAQRGNPDMDWFSEDGHNCPLARNSEEWHRSVRKSLRYRGTRSSHLTRTRKRLLSVYGSEAVLARWKAVFDL